MAATVAMGLMAGVFALYANAIMPGLRRTDDRTFVGAFQAIDRAIENPGFLLGGFLGAPVLTGLAALMLFGDRALPWILLALALYLVAFVVTLAVNLPLNRRLRAAGEPDRITDLARVRVEFNETRWVRWNLVRAIVTVAALGCLVWAFGQR
jgi:uncharacterized membrane protein